MLTVCPMPCCGIEIPLPVHNTKVTENGVLITDVADYSKFGWDPETGKCRNCGEDGEQFRCASPTCRCSVDREVRFCEGCQGAFEMGQSAK